ncbi:MAG: efflux RND transporter periplasmic adaptor subunit [Planctomycetota bacterium]
MNARFDLSWLMALAASACLLTVAMGDTRTEPTMPAASRNRGSATLAQQPLVGLTAPSHLAAIAAEQSGTIVEMSVEDGQRVEPNDVLFRLSSKLQQLQVDRLQATLDSELEQQRAQANVEHARKKAERVQALLEKEISAEAAAAEVQLESRLATISLGTVDFERQQLNNELLQAKERLAQRTLRSPLNGILTRRFKRLGETADQLEPVVEVMSLDPLWIQFECPVAREHDFPLGGAVRVQRTVGKHRVRTATIEHVSLQSAVASHTFLVRASMPNPDYSWRSGLKVRIEPTTTPATPTGK